MCSCTFSQTVILEVSLKAAPREEAVARGVKSFHPGHTSLSVADGLLSWSCRVVYSHVSQCAKGILFAC